MSLTLKQRQFVEKNVTNDNYQQWGRLATLPVKYLSEILDYMIGGLLLPSEILELSVIDVDTVQNKIKQVVSADPETKIDYSTWRYLAQTLELSYGLKQVVDLDFSSTDSSLNIIDFRLPVYFTEPTILKPRSLLKPRVSATTVQSVFDLIVRDKMVTNIFGSSDADLTFWLKKTPTAGKEWVAYLKNRISNFAFWYPQYTFQAFIGCASGSQSSLFIYKNMFDALDIYRNNERVGFYGPWYQKQFIVFTRNVSFVQNHSLMLSLIQSEIESLLTSINNGDVLLTNPVVVLSRLTACAETYSGLKLQGVSTSNLDQFMIDFTEVVDFIDKTLMYIKNGFELINSNMRKFEEV